MYVRELHVRYRQRPVPARYTPHLIGTPRDAAALFTRILGGEVIEVCGLVCLSSKRDIIAYHELSRGTLDMTIVHPRDVLRIALLSNAASVIVGHNHPSGVVRPSPEDVGMTQRLRAATDVMGIQLADHIIVNVAGEFFSFRDASLI